MSNADGITLTPRAIEMGKQKVADAETPVEGLRLGIKGGGCSGYYYVYDAEGRTSLSIARQIAARTSSLGQPGVQLIGPENKRVNRVVLGTGAITPMFHFIEKLNADMAICTDDGFVYWRDGAYAIDSEFPVAVVNHPVSEEYAMKLLAGHLRKRFPQVPVHHIPERCMYKLVSGS